jgi:hypothetical protein
LWVFRPETAFDWRGIQNSAIRARHLVVDLLGADDPAADWEARPGPDLRPCRFNYDRSLY